MEVISVTKAQSLSRTHVLSQLFVVDLALDLVRDQQHEDVTELATTFDWNRVKSIGLCFVHAIVADTGNGHFHSTVAEIERLRTSLIAVPDNHDSLALKNAQIGVGITVHDKL
jgi:hypothetical protein